MTDETQEPKQRPLGDYLTKPATTLQERFANWLQEEVGYNPNGAKTKLEAFQEGVRLATATRMVFQASDYNREARAAEQEAKAAEAEETEEAAPAPAKKAAAPAKKAAPPAKRAAKKAANPAPVAEEEPQEEAEVSTPAKKAPARRAPARRTTSASAAAAPF